MNRCCRVTIVAMMTLSMSVVSGCGYFEAAENIKTERVVAKTLLIEDSVHVAASASENAGSVRFADQAVALAAFTEYVHPIVEKNCGKCHGAVVSPPFAEESNVSSFTAIMAANIINFTEPKESRIVKRLTEQSHNCWNDCPKDGEILAAAIQAWAANAEILDSSNDPTIVYKTIAVPLKDRVQAKAAPPAEGEAAPAEEQPDYIYVEAEDNQAFSPITVAEADGASGGLAIFSQEGGRSVLPEDLEDPESLGRIVVDFDVPETGNYRVFAKVKGSGQETDSYFVKINDGDIGVWDVNVGQDAFEWTPVTFRTERNGRANALNPRLEEGRHTLTIYERGEGTYLDAIVITQNANIDLTTISSASSTKISFDLSSLKPELGEGVAISVIIEDYNEQAYLLRNVAIRTGGKKLHVKNIKPIVNDYYLDQHATYTDIDQVISDPIKILSTAPLLLLKDKGLAEDNLSLALEVLEIATE